MYGFMRDFLCEEEKSKKITVLISLLGNFGKYKKVTYQLNNSKYVTNFVLDALSQHYDPDIVILFVPESLLLQIFDKEKVIDFLSSKYNIFTPELNPTSNILSKLKEVNPQISKILEKKGVILFIPSAGTYDLLDKSTRVYFDNNILSIEMYVFSLLFRHLGSFLHSLCELEIIFDASHGHNLYVVSIMEAIRRLVVMKGIASAKDLIGRREEKFNIAISSPVIGEKNEKDVVPIYLTDVNVKLFDFLPDYKKISTKSNNLFEYFEKNDVIMTISKEKKSEDGKKFYSNCGVSSYFLGEIYLANYLLNKGALLYLINRFSFNYFNKNYESLLSDLTNFQIVVDCLIKKFKEYSVIEKNDKKIIMKRYPYFNKNIFDLLYYYALYLKITYIFNRFFKPRVYELLRNEYYYVDSKDLETIYKTLYGKSHVYTSMYKTEINKYYNALKNKGSFYKVIENYHKLVSALEKMNEKNIDIHTIDLDDGANSHKIEIYKINSLLYGTKFIENSSKKDSSGLFIAPAVIDKDDLKFINLYVLWRKEKHSGNSNLFRNFIAHLGLIKEITYLAIKNNKIYLGSFNPFFINMKEGESYEKIVEKIKIIPHETYADQIEDIILK